MKKTAFLAIVAVSILFFGAVGFAETHEEQGQMGAMMSGQGMAGKQMMAHHGMSGHEMKGRHHMKGGCAMGMGMMGASMVSTGDGGIAVLMGNTLYKYDKDLNLLNQTEIPFDYKGMKDRMMKMRDMHKGMSADEAPSTEPAPDQDEKQGKAMKE